MAGAAGKVAVAGGGRVQVLDVASSTMTSYELPGVAHVAFDAESKLLAATPTSVFQEVEGGALGSVYDAPSDGGAIHGLVTSGSRVWMALGTELGVLEAGVVSRTTGVGLPADAKLVASTTGDVWALAAGELLRFSRDAQGEGAELWKEGVEPIFARACSQCHLASGPAGIDLSTYTAWVSRRSAIQERVVVQRNMPPPGADFSEEDRAAIAAWVQSGL
jgi:mono/diheme cytochrome c family protein